MTAERVSLQPAFVLRRQAYRETSVLLDVLSRDFGKVALIAKGVRKAKSKTAAILQPFVLLNLSYLGQSGLQTMTAAEPAGVINLTGLAVHCGFYANELLQHFLHPHDPHPELFGDYRQCLVQLAAGVELQAALRRFELALIKHCGYGFPLDIDCGGQLLQTDKQYRFAFGEGFVADPEGDYTGGALLAIHGGDFSQPAVLKEAKRLMRGVIDSHLQGKILHSRTVINQIVKRYERS